MRSAADPGWLSALSSLPQVDTASWAEPWRTLVGTPLNVAVTVVVALLLRYALHRLIDRFSRQAMDRRESRLAALKGAAGRLMGDASGVAGERHRQRTAATAALLKSISTVAVFVVGLLTVLSLIGLPLAPLLASAGVGGVALGFGAQSLVRDFLSGIFMIVEDQFGVGDVIDTGSVVGTVEDVTLRITRLRDGDGVVWYVRNGEILKVGNRSQGWSVAVVDVPVGYEEDLGRVSGVLDGAVGPLDEEEPWAALLLERPTVTGIESLAGGQVTLRVTAKCRANERDGVQREIRERVKAALDANGIALATPPPPTP